MPVKDITQPAETDVIVQKVDMEMLIPLHQSQSVQFVRKGSIQAQQNRLPVLLAQKGNIFLIMLLIKLSMMLLLTAATAKLEDIMLQLDKLVVITVVQVNTRIVLANSHAIIVQLGNRIRLALQLIHICQVIVLIVLKGNILVLVQQRARSV